jgi:hypothetical protein
VNRRLFSLPALVAGFLLAAAPGPAAQSNPFVGSWNISGTGPDASMDNHWLEIKEEGGKLTGSFLAGSGHAMPLVYARIENGELVFQRGNDKLVPQGTEYRMRAEGGRLVGSYTAAQGGRRGGAAATDAAAPAAPPPAPRVINIVGVRRPTWPALNANGKHTYGTPVALVDGKTMDAWEFIQSNRPAGWSIVNGVMTKPEPGQNLRSKQSFQDFKLDAEFRVGTGSNGGIYLRGRYELQLMDDFGKPASPGGNMAYYHRATPTMNASKPAGEWQTVEIILVGNRLSVTLNGQRIHDNVEVTGITGGAMDNDETAPGPFMLQGDHAGDISFRKFLVTPITKPGN